MSKQLTKSAVKKAAYAEVMRTQSKHKAKPRWLRHSWDNEKDCLVTRFHPGVWRAPGPDWHREGSIDEIEQRENAGQRDMFS